MSSAFEKMIKLVVFDWNGTILADTMANFEASNEVLRVLKKKLMKTMTEYRRKLDLPILKFYLNCGFTKEYVEKNTQLLQHVWHTYYEERAKNNRTRKGTRELLEYLKKNNMEAIVLSNHIVDKIEFQLERLNMQEDFDKILANRDTGTIIKRKTKKHQLEEYMKKRKIKPKEAILVGDSPEEIEIARKIGAKSITITNGHFDTPRLKSLKPDFLVNNMLEIKEIVKKLK